MTSIAKAPGGPPQRITGSSVAWGRDLGLIGAVTGAGAPALVLGLSAWPFVVASALTGLVAGLLLGFEMPWFLESARRKLSLPAIAFRCTLAGGAVGGMIGLIASHLSGQLFLAPFVIAGIAGGLQLGWLWLPYTILTVTGRPTWPVVVAACAVAPLLGPIAMGVARLLVAAFLG